MTETRPDRRAGGTSLRLACSIVAVLGLSVGVGSARAASTGTTDLINLLGPDLTVGNGDYVSADEGLSTHYSFFLEVPDSASNLVVDLFDADFGPSGYGSDNHDIRGSGSWSTEVEYRLYDPSGALQASLYCSAGSCTSWDDDWENLFTTSNPDPGHWELQMDAAAPSSGDDRNMVGLRAHDGDTTAGGTEINIYAHSYIVYAVYGSSGDTQTFEYYPYITGGTSYVFHEYDSDESAGEGGSASWTSRTGDYGNTQGSLSGASVWGSHTVGGWTSDGECVEYGIWSGDLTVTIPGSQTGNVVTAYVGEPGTTAPPSSQPESNTGRIYFPRDGGGAPTKPYVETVVAHYSGPNPPVEGETSTVQVWVTVENPTNHPIQFSNSNVVTVNIPGSGAVYNAATPSQGSLVSQPSVGGTGDVDWNPGTIAGQGTAHIEILVDVTPTAPGQVIPVVGNNGATVTFSDETGESMGFGSLCTLQVTEAQATYVLVTDFEAQAVDGDVVLTWETASEAGTVGFRVERLDPLTDEWIAVHDGTLLAMHEVLGGGRYRLIDDDARPGQQALWRIVERNTSGTDQVVGPFAVTPRPAGHDERPMRSRFERAPRLPSGPAGARALPRWLSTWSPPPPGAPPSDAVRVLVDGPGPVRLDAAELADALQWSPALVETAIAGQQLALTHHGTPVAWIGAPDASALTFVAADFERLYADHDVYWIESGAGVAAGAVTSAAPDPVGGESFQTTVTAEQDVFPATVVGPDPDLGFWFWQVVSPTDVGLEVALLELDLDGVDAAPATGWIELEVHGASESGIAGEHHSEVRVNGTPVGEIQFEGYDRHTAQIPVDQDLLVEGLNTVEVEGLLDPGVTFSVIYVDRATLAYQRTYEATGPALTFAADGHATLSLTGFDQPDITVLRVDDPAAPVEVLGGVIDDLGNGEWGLRYVPDDPAARYVAFTPGGAAPSLALIADTPSDLSSTAHDEAYLVIAPADLRGPAEQLAAHRAAQGLPSLVVDLQDIYDEFHGGVPDPHAIHTFLTYAHEHWAAPPRYVLLAGKGTLDYLDIWGYGDNLVPPLLAQADGGLFAADSLLADVAGDDGVPDLALGRLPVRSADELQWVVDKIIAYEGTDASAWDHRVLMSADADDGDSDWSAASDVLTALLPDPFEATPVYLEELGPTDARDALFDGLADGAAVWNYLGHGGMQELTSDSLLLVDDVASMANGDRLPVLAAWTCLISRYEFPGYATLGEALVVEPEAGAIAVWAPSGLSEDAYARQMARDFFVIAFASSSPRLGDVLLETQQRYLALGGAPEMVAVYQLLGDPALDHHVDAPPDPEINGDDDDDASDDDTGDDDTGDDDTGDDDAGDDDAGNPPPQQEDPDGGTGCSCTGQSVNREAAVVLTGLLAGVFGLRRRRGPGGREERRQ